jgi:hypothetical protein
MTAKKTANKLTVDDLRRKAEQIQETVKDDVRRAARDELTTIAIIGGIAVVGRLSLTYYLGSRRG